MKSVDGDVAGIVFRAFIIESSVGKDEVPLQLLLRFCSVKEVLAKVFSDNPLNLNFCLSSKTSSLLLIKKFEKVHTLLLLICVSGKGFEEAS